jgi:phospholipid transport system substrate-binding protein
MLTPRFITALAVGIVAVAPAHAQQMDPAARIGAYHDGIVAIMKAKLGFEARRDRFEALVRENYDMPAIASLVVGPKWTSSSATERNDAIAALTRHSAVSLAKNFTSYHGEQFTVDPAVVDRGESKVVKAKIGGSGGGGDTLLYVMRKGAAGWKIIDVVAQGVSQLAVQRSDAASAVASQGVGGLAKELGKLDSAAR